MRARSVRGARVLTVTATLLIAITMALVNGGATLVAVNRFYVAWTLPFAAMLLVLAFAPGRRIASSSREEVLRWAD